MIPVGKYRTSQYLYRFRRKGDEVLTDDLGAFAFAPLIGDEGWHLV
ncbi:MAG: hypothetical protein H8E66_04415 [Planctomycetes bacterium]|nr:hypothetical protein [Planctomycetota bacterium]